jgi:hypothetical protein
MIPLAGALCAASVASAQVSTTAAQTPATKAAADPAVAAALAKGDGDKRICKAVTATGTRLGKAKICRTAREWAAQTEQDRRSLERMQGTRTSPNS